MIQITDKSQCCGCTACASVCAHQAITMKPDALGFLYPVVDESKCTDCGLCEKVCAFHADYDKTLNLSVPDVFAARHQKMEEIERSRSGAMFAAVSDWVLAQGGVVYGAGYADHFRVVHKRATTCLERDEFRGSKYVQSDLNDVFIQVAKDLKAGMLVLFTGTPCQTSGLRSFLNLKRIKTDTLYLVDIVCHGVPSPFYWRDYLAYIEKKKGEKVTAVNFRDKSKLGWAAHKESFTFADGITYTYTYTYAFYQHIMFRRSCGKCHFTNFQRPSDLTLADFWGWEKVDTSFNADDKGVSLVLVNTAKGKELFDAVKHQMNCIQTDTTNCLQPNLQYPSEIHPLRDSFEQDYQKHGFVYVAKKYGDLGWRFKMRRLKQKCRTAIRLLIGR